MTLSRNLALLAAIALIAGASTLVGTLHAQANKKPGTAVASVDIEKVFSNLNERANVEARIQTRIGELQKWEQDKQKEIRDLQEDLKMLQAGTPAFEQTSDKLRKALIELRVELEVGQRQIEQEKALQLEALYLKIIDTVGTVAKQEGYDMVLFKDNTPPMRGANQQQIASLIQLRKAIYVAEHLDLTEQVQQRMNNAFRQ